MTGSRLGGCELTALFRCNKIMVSIRVAVIRMANSASVQ